MEDGPCVGTEQRKLSRSLVMVYLRASVGSDAELQSLLRRFCASAVKTNETWSNWSTKTLVAFL